MAYVSLYRKYRPQSFADVVGQDHVIRTLVNAIDEDRLHHAYLFTGPRGTGKTSTARLLAKAINCEAGPTSEPCDTCDQCVAITQGTSVDVIELDMASHGGVDDARELRDRALFAPASARRRVYILDEVHMASTAAFNALLKLIEEPPSHVLFAMATTDPQKVLPTILSRVQRLDLRRVSADDVAGNVRKLCELEGYRIEDDAIDAIVRAGDGSLRDTQSILEQVLAFAGTEVSAAAVAQVLGATPMDRVEATVDRLGERDLAGLLGLVQSLLDDGHDLRRFTLDLVQHLRDLMVLSVAPDRPDLVDATDDRRRRLQAQADVLPRATVLRAVELLAATVAEQRQGSPRLPLELCLAQLAVPGADGDVAELADRVARLEAGAPAKPTSPARHAAEPAPTAPTTAPAPAPPAPALPATESSPPVAAAVPPVTEPAAAPPAAEPSAPVVEEPEVVLEVPEPVEAATKEPPAAASARSTDTLQDRARARAKPKAEPSPAASAESPAASAESPAASAEPSPAASAESPAARAESPAASAESPAAPAESPAASAESPAAPAESPPASAETPAASAESPDRASAADDATVPTAEDRDPTTVVLAHWDGVLELVRQASKRSHAMFEPATPVTASRGILTLRYARRYASFHAANAKRTEFADVLIDAIERSCGLKLRLDVVIDGDDDRRRPMPPSVTPDDARTPVLDEDPVDEQEEVEVREAEHDTSAPAAPVDVEQLLATELDAELFEEQPPPGRESA